MLRRFYPLPSHVILTGFLILSVLALTLTGGWMLQRMRDVQDAALQSNLNASKREVASASQVILQAIDKQIFSINSWDETHQQLHDHTFYDYWRHNRALQAGVVADYVVAIELYDGQGHELRQEKTKSLLPAQYPGQQQYIRKQDGRFLLYAYAPINDRLNEETAGGVGIAIDFLQAFKQLNRFRYTETDSIGLLLDEGGQSSVDGLADIIQYQPLPLPQTQALEDVMSETLLRLAITIGVLALVAYLLVQHFLQQPLQRLSRHIEALRRGIHRESPENMPPLCVKELETVRTSLNEYQHDLETMHSSLSQKNQELWNMAHHDPLTGALNRRAYDEDWQQLSSLISGQRLSISVMLLDCDHFKAINDSYGHDIGDQVIKAVASTLRKTLRDGDRFYRLGGDEFAIHLMNTNADETHFLAQRCQEAIGAYPFKELGIREPVRFSVGIAYAEGTDTTELSRLHKHADIAMYQAKRPGQLKIVQYQPSLNGGEDALVSSRYVNAIYEAIENGTGLELNFQPIINLRDKSGSYYEVLARLHDDQGLIMPSHIFPVIIAEGLETEFDTAIIRQIATQLGNGVIPDKASLSINLDGMSLVHDSILQEVLKLKPYLLNRKIVLEVTETALITEMREANAMLGQLRQAGFKIALDDFGSGYSSLRYLSSMPVDIIKFDISMVRDLERSDGQQKIVEDVARMILSAGYQLVAEGVETPALLERVRALGFTHAQGFLFDRPMAHIQDAIPSYPSRAPR